MGLLLKNLIFTLLIPGTTAIYVPLLAVRGRDVGLDAAALFGGLLGASIGAGVPRPKVAKSQRHQR